MSVTWTAPDPIVWTVTTDEPTDPYPDDPDEDETEVEGEPD